MYHRAALQYYKLGRIKIHCSRKKSALPLFQTTEENPSNQSPEKEFQFLQTSPIHTMHFQDSLPRLPLPDLEKTCQRYLNALRPIIHSEKLKVTERIVKDFKNGEGKELQSELKALNSRNKHMSYLSSPWMDMYLESRKPLVPSSNPTILLVDDPNSKYNNQIVRTTNIMISSLRFLKSLRENVLEPELYHINPKKSNTEIFRQAIRLIPRSFATQCAYLFKAIPRDMSGFSSLFSSTRIPRLRRDELVFFPDARHVLVLRNGHFYVFDALDSVGNLYPPSYLLSCIKSILADPQPIPSHPVSVLTTADRDTWANARDRLVELGNGEQLNLIDSSLFVLALDDEAHGGNIERETHSMYHGSAQDRWFDKCFTWIISREGKVGINFEHSWKDGFVILRLLVDVYNDTTQNPFVGPDDISIAANYNDGVRRLEFCLDDSVKQTIDEARLHHLESAKNFQQNFVKNTLHRKFIKSLNLSPDFIAQLGFLMAFYRVHNKLVSIYESCSTSTFKHGRTEVVRPLTMATKRLVETLHSTIRPSKSELMRMLTDCSKSHNQLIKAAAQGQGFDRHLFALRSLSAKLYDRNPAIFEDMAFAEINHRTLGTSTLPFASIECGGYGPIVPNGLIIGYSFLEDAFQCLISSYRNHRDGAAVADALNASFEELYVILN